ncbi:hypothetical protein F5Y01DRAFT_282306 [Xylaria sp. FL0043]|nr:hypothetical protein F5Y01DRAFT_282306 [Xylaria sp. FL0043]
MQGWLMGAAVRGGACIFCRLAGPSSCALPDYACHVPTSTAIIEWRHVSSSFVLSSLCPPQAGSPSTLACRAHPFAKAV